MKATSDAKLKRADRRVTKMKQRIRLAARQAGLDGERAEHLVRAAGDYGMAVASLCIEVERMAEQENWHDDPTGGN